MTSKVAIRLLAVVFATFTLASCITVMPNLSVKPSTTVPGRPLDMEVAIIATPAMRQPLMAHELPSQCLGGIQFAPTSFGDTMLNTLRDRFQRQFANVVVVPDLAQAEGADAVFEASVSDAGFMFGCLIAPQQAAEVQGSIRALDYSGREMWRSATTKGRYDTGLDWSGQFNQFVGDGFSQAMGKLVDLWADEIRAMDPNRYAAVEGIEFVTAEPQAPRLQTVRRAAPRAPRGPQFPKEPVKVVYPDTAQHPDDIAVIIGNADYSKMGEDIPNVTPAYADAEGFKRFLTEGKGLRVGNVIDLRDATGSQLIRVFGSPTNYRGQLYDWVRKGRSNVWVYYAGHGAPAEGNGSPFLIPVDADAARIDLNGYPLDLMYRNLAKLDAKSVTVVLEACFSGASQDGAVISNASPVYLKAKAPDIPAGVTVIAAGGPNQMASWEEDKSHSLFTKYFLKGMSGEADKSPYGNGDKAVTNAELDAYLKDTVTYYARRYYGRDQTAVILGGK